MCPKSRKINKDEEISMDSDDLLLPNKNEEVEEITSKAFRLVHEKYQNLSVKDLVENEEDLTAEYSSEDDKWILLPKRLAKLLPSIGSTANLNPQDIRIPVKLSLGSSLNWYIYEYDGNDIVHAYYTSRMGVIIGASSLSISGISGLEFESEDEFDSLYAERDLKWDLNTTLKQMRDEEYFATKEHIQQEEARTQEILVSMEKEIEGIKKQENASIDEEVF